MVPHSYGARASRPCEPATVDDGSVLDHDVVAELQAGWVHHPDVAVELGGREAAQQVSLSFQAPRSARAFVT